MYLLFDGSSIPPSFRHSPTSYLLTLANAHFWISGVSSPCTSSDHYQEDSCENVWERSGYSKLRSRKPFQLFKSGLYLERAYLLTFSILAVRSFWWIRRHSLLLNPKSYQPWLTPAHWSSRLAFMLVGWLVPFFCFWTAWFFQWIGAGCPVSQMILLLKSMIGFFHYNAQAHVITRKFSGGLQNLTKSGSQSQVCHSMMDHLAGPEKTYFDPQGFPSTSFPLHLTVGCHEGLSSLSLTWNPRESTQDK